MDLDAAQLVDLPAVRCQDGKIPSLNKSTALAQRITEPHMLLLSYLVDTPAMIAAGARSNRSTICIITLILDDDIGNLVTQQFAAAAAANHIHFIICRGF